MLDIGPEKLAVLALVGLIVLGPDKLPPFARDAARMFRTLRELSLGVRGQLGSQLGPEIAGLGLAALNPRAALTALMFAEPGRTADAAVSSDGEVLTPAATRSATTPRLPHVDGRTRP